MKLVKTTLKVFLFLFAGSISAFISGYVVKYEITDEIHTIGTKTWHGFPLQHVMNAPGLAWAQWDINAFSINVLFYAFVFWLLTMFLVHKLRD
jgi:hypothetical protein